ncbi:peptidase M3 [Adhaeribacter aerolatus]|uniref:Peptidase M3 n=1 Tax=Adhaeribacter aerolatus TaxID=670289 RepID=A0A512B4N7_9BACT|nr:M3 family metallopeptidase [Adhaeribacter aerolatus]GEO06935.1 peptidase M3 [Adhaeribacter aerolatus]
MNILLEEFATPFNTVPFNQIQKEYFLPALKEAIQIGTQEINAIKTNPETPNFSNTIEKVERSGELVDRISRIFFNLNAAETNPEIQQLAKEISPLLTAYANDITLDQELFNRVKAVYDQRDRLNLNTEQQTLLDKLYKSFIRNGANLNEAGKNQLRQIDQQLGQLSLTFGEHVLSETNDYYLAIDNPTDLEGLPESVVEAAALAAQEKGLAGQWVFTLQAPSYLPFITYAQNRMLREELYKAYATRACKNNPNDNRSIILDLVKLRHERANLLGFSSHADYVLQERMAQSPNKVVDFLNNLLRYAKPAARQELEAITAFASQNHGPETLQRWDITYYAEKVKKEKFNIDDEVLKPYFKLENVIQGIFEVANRLYGLHFKENTEVSTYHPDVKVFEVTEESGEHLGIFYADFFPRPGKRNGAWMTSFRGQKKENGQDQRPHIAIVCNFTQPTPTKPSLLTFNEVKTLFHEFGHALHGLLANGTYGSLTGTNVFWDFVELPSQVMENWTYEKECLDLFSRHYETGELIPAELVQKIKDSSNFMAGYATVRQIGLARLDMAWHMTPPEEITEVIGFENQILQETEILPLVPGTNISCSFSHIFQGGYSSGYYSYKWAEVLDADAFEFFQENGVFNRETSTLFRKHILSAGGSEPPMELYKRFRGKEPSPEALLRRTGLLASESAA